MGAYSRGGDLERFLVVGQIPVEMFLLVYYFFDASHRNNRMLFE